MVTAILIEVSSGVEDALLVGSGRRVLGEIQFFSLHNPFSDTKTWVLYKVQLDFPYFKIGEVYLSKVQHYRKIRLHQNEKHLQNNRNYK